MTAARRNRDRMVVTLGALIGTLGAVLRSVGANTTNCLVFSAVFGCLLGTAWQRPGLGLTGALAAFGLWSYLAPHITTLVT